VNAKYFVNRSEAAEGSSLEGPSLEGPLTAEELLAGLRARRFSHVDLVYSADSGEWKTIGEVSGAEGRGSSVSQDKVEWIVLKLKDQKEGKGISCGPFAKESVLAAIAAGEISYSDLIWRPGEKSWTRIGSRDDFDRRSQGETSALNFQGALAGLDFEEFQECAESEELLASVVTLTREPVASAWMEQSEEALPDEAVGSDLVADDGRGSVGSSKSLIFKSVLAFACLAAGLSVLAPPEARAHQEKKVLEVLPLKSETSQPILVFQSNAKVGEVIRVRLKARTGEILQVTSLEREFEVRREPGEIPSLNLGEKGLPRGAYRVEAFHGDARAESAIFFGVKDEAFEKEMRDHAKAIARQQQSEKKALFYVSKEMQKLVRKFDSQIVQFRSRPGELQGYVQGWTAEVKSASAPLLSMARQKPETLAYPEDILAFRQAVESLLEGASAEALRIASPTAAEATGAGSRQIASSRLDELGRAFADLSAKAAMISSQD
jgi:hypothetical protein